MKINGAQLSKCCKLFVIRFLSFYLFHSLSLSFSCIVFALLLYKFFIVSHCTVALENFCKLRNYCKNNRNVSMLFEKKLISV